MTGTIVASHIPGAQAYLWAGDERGETPASASLNSVTGSFTLSTMLYPHTNECGWYSRGDYSASTNWGVVIETFGQGRVRLGLQDETNNKIFFESTMQIGAVDRPTEFTVRFDETTKEVSMFTNAVPRSVDFNDTLSSLALVDVASSFSNLKVPSSGDTKWYFGWVAGKKQFKGVFYGDYLVPTALSDSEIYDYYLPRAYPDTPAPQQKIYYASQAPGAGNYMGLYRMNLNGSAKELIFQLGGAGGISCVIPRPSIGKLLIGVTGGSDQSGYYVMNYDGSSVQQLTGPNGNLAHAGGKGCWVTDTVVALPDITYGSYHVFLVDITLGADYTAVTPPSIGGHNSGFNSDNTRYMSVCVDTRTAPFKYIINSRKYTGAGYADPFGIFITPSIRGDGSLAQVLGNYSVASGGVLDLSTLMVTGDGGHILSSLTQSYDQAKLAFYQKHPVSGLDKTYIMNTSGGGINQINFGNYNIYPGAFNPNGSSLLVQANKAGVGTAQIYSLTVDGANMVNLSENGNTEYPLAWLA